MAYEITTTGFFSVMYDELESEMINLLNMVEMDDGTYIPETARAKKLCKVALSKGFIDVVI